MAAAIVCWRCGEPGHGYADCQPEPAKTTQELDERIDRLVERWQEFIITLPQKRLWIQMEINAHEREKAKMKKASGNAMSDE